MKPSKSLAGAAALVAAASLSSGANAATYPVMFSVLNGTATLTAPLAIGDTLFVDTLVTMETGALSQTVTFSLASPSFVSGAAAWQVTAPTTGTTGGPRLVGVNIDLFNSANVLAVSDGNVTLANTFATSSIAETFLPAGTYRLTATGTGVRTSSLDVSLTVSAVPEPQGYALMLAGLAAVGFVARRRSVKG